MHSNVFPRLLAALGLAAIVATPLAAPATALASTVRAGALFVNRTSSTASPGIRIDPAGGTHVVAAGYYTGIWPGDDPSGPAYYTYCAPNADCSNPTAWSQVKLGSNVAAAQIELTPTGMPRLLLESVDSSATGTGFASYWYAACDSNCTAAAGWSLIDVADTNIIETSIWDETKHSFALDRAGRPRFLYGSGELVYATCDTSCTGTRRDPDSGDLVPSNWRYAELYEGLFFNEPSLAFTSNNQPRVVSQVYDPDGDTFWTDYLECNANCSNGASWTGVGLMPEGSAPLGLSIRVDATNRVGVVVSESGRLWYWQCANTCANPANWSWTDWDGLSARDADLAYDAQNRPHLAFGTAGGPFGYGLAYASCLSACATSAAQWSGGQVEDTGALDQDLPLPMPAQCTAAGWFGAFRPSLALDGSGNPRFASDNQFWASCPDHMGLVTVFEAARVVFTTNPFAAAAPYAAAVGRAPLLAASRSGAGAGRLAAWRQHLAHAHRTRVTAVAPPGGHTRRH